MTREYGASSRQYKNALIWCVPESVASLHEETRKVLAWESIDADKQLLKEVEDAQKQQLAESLGRAKRDLKASVWRSYRRLVLLGKDNETTTLDLGQMNASGGALVSQILMQLQQRDELTATVGPAFLVRNWPPAFTEWSTRNVRNAFFASPRFPRLQRADILKETIAKGVTEGVLAYVGKAASGDYEPLQFKQPINASDVDISDEMYIITAATATAYLAAVQQRQDASTGAAAGQPDARAFLGSGYAYPAGSRREERAGDGLFGTPEPAVTPPPGGATASIGKVAWSGDIPSQKWTTFYTKVLSGLVTSGELTLRVSFEAALRDGLTLQRLESIRAALRELGLPDDVETTR